jgi:hypothetical protein
VRQAAFGQKLSAAPADAVIRDVNWRYVMGDKGKKDKEKNRKQKLVKETQETKKAQEKSAVKLLFQKS